MDEQKSPHEIAAQTQPHDEHGHFAPKPKTDIPPQQPQPSITTQSPLISQPTKQKKDPSLDEPLVSFAINNPFKKILQWIDEIRRKQTTEFDVKLKIPLLGWAVLVGVIFGAVNVTQYLQNVQLSELLGKYINTTKSVTVIVPTAVPSPVLLSRMGVLKATYQLNGIISPTPSSPSQPTSYVLVTSIDQMTFLTVNSGVSLAPYLNKQVLVTGLFDSGKNVIHIRQDTDVQYVP